MLFKHKSSSNLNPYHPNLYKVQKCKPSVYKYEQLQVQYNVNVPRFTWPDMLLYRV